MTWSDGEAFTADDIVFTFGMYTDGSLVDASGFNIQSIDTDGDAVTITFGQSMFVRQASVLHTPIAPKHIWENIEDPSTDPITGEGRRSVPDRTCSLTGPRSLSRLRRTRTGGAANSLCRSCTTSPTVTTRP